MSEVTKGTSVDLGDDLIETRTVSYDGRKPRSTIKVTPDEISSASESIEELLLNSKILMSEGLHEDAKKTLRHVLRMDPSNLSARDRLEEIQKIEIRRLLGQDETSNGGGFLRPKKKKSDPALEDCDAVCAALERELGSVPGTEEKFFSEQTSQEDFFANLDFFCAGATLQDRIDLGIGFLEMEFFDVAIRLFQTVAQQNPEDRRAHALLATAWVAKGNGFEAMVEIEALIADQSTPPEEKVDYGYLAGRAQDLLQNFEMAVHWYRAVIQIEPHYRDTDDRLRQSLKRLVR